MDKVILNSSARQDFFLDYLNFLEAIKTSCKAFHWGIMNTIIQSKRGAHIYLDEFLNIISDYQDMIAETSQGILGSYITPNNVKAKSIKELESPNDLCKYLLDNVLIFYNKLNQPSYVGIKSETETFIKDIQKYNFLFTLCP